MILPLLVSFCYAQFIAFNPPLLQLNDSSLLQSFSLSLANPIQSPVQIYFSANQLSFVNCSVSFTPDNWNIPKTIQFTTVPVFSDANGSTFNITTRYFNGTTAIDQFYPVKRIIAKGGTCLSMGDPHIKPFNYQIQGENVSTIFTESWKIPITNNALGTFYLFKHKYFDIQATQLQCFTEASCNHAIAIRYGKSILALDIRNNITLENIKMQKVTAIMDGMVYTSPSEKDKTHTVTLPCGSSIQMTVNDYLQDRWIDISLALSPGYANSGGLCNQIDDLPNTLRLSNNSVVQLDGLNSFLESWKVPDSDNFLLGKYKLIDPPTTLSNSACMLPHQVLATTTSTISPTQILGYYKTLTTISSRTTTEPATATGLANSANTITITSTFSNVLPTTVEAGLPTASPSTSLTFSSLQSSFTSVLASTSLTTTLSSVATKVGYSRPTPSAEFISKVKQQCEKALTIPGCSSILPIAFYITSCISDTLLTGTCLKLSKTLYPQVSIATQGQQIQKSYGFGNNSCVNSCSNNGKCGDIGCICKLGFSGIDCSLVLPKDPVYARPTTTMVYSAAQTGVQVAAGKHSTGTQMTVVVTNTPVGYSKSGKCPI
ncbi:hypothetical protein HDV02_001007 [Globomyces sp. JEL0801]|nr:hypothetical protein HDV02_001007 [Globomyces sp. JEL0801]